MNADALLTTTRTVRRRLDLDRPVPRSVILQCIDLASQAPIGNNLEQCRWLVIDDPERRKALAAIYRRSFGPYRAEQTPLLGDPGGSAHRVMSSAEHLAEVLHRVPVHVIPCRFDRPPINDMRHLATFYGSILPAVWSFMLALRSKGLGSAWTTLHLDHEGDAADLLGIPDTITQLALIPVAYTIGDSFRPVARKPAAAITYWNRWGSKEQRS